MSSGLRTRLLSLCDRIDRACRAAGRDRKEVQLIGVGKTKPAELIRDAATAGVLDIGENYVQEMSEKCAALLDLPIRWHFIGRLQRNKVKKLMPHAAIIHAVDSLALVKEIARRAEDGGRVQKILLAVNVAGEEQKGGVAPAEVRALCEAIAALPTLECGGLMTIPPAGDPESCRPHFRALRTLRDELSGAHPSMVHLSMGMSDDLEVAIEEGATFIRVGSALFGPRDPAADASSL